LRQLKLEFIPLARAKSLELTFVPCSLGVRSDRRLLRRLLQNLVSNAIKYTGEGRVLIGCRRHRGKLRIEVHDTGLGIPKSKQRIIFTEFHRLDTGARVARGLGLGLSIVERIARVLDYKIDVRSEVGRGSLFAIEVPCAGGHVTQQTPRRSVRLDPRQLTGTTVLCVDNDPAVLDGMETLLNSWGCHVLKAPDLETAVAAALESPHPPDGLLIDYHLDHGNGVDVVIALRRQFGADIPAILITADRSPVVREAAREHNMQVLNKPVKPAALRAVLAQCRVQRVVAAE
jgi:CheY-like chemotaxis protein/anti-sigma regulatory factor (Ser/Thr protein kinase)